MTLRARSLVPVLCLGLLAAAPAQAWRGGQYRSHHHSHHHHGHGNAVALGVLGGFVGAVVLDRILTAPVYVEPRPVYGDPYRSGYSDGYDRGYRRGQGDRSRDGRERGYDDGYAAGRGY